MAPSELPQAGQKARLEYADERQVAGAPPAPVQRTDWRGNSTQLALGAPVCLRQKSQEQV